MATFESTVKTITSNEEQVYGTLSDLRNLEQSKHMVPGNTIQDIEFYEDKCHFTVNPIGKIDLSIIDKQPYKLIKLGADNAPIDFHVNIHLNKADDNQTNLHVNAHADIPPMVKMMFGGRMQQFVDQFAEALAGINYK
ncbi:SRPBCC family protein [Paludibacter sp.]|uniref:SRPBCC family protein n=1 Tax=Paludibacter sp. TaxID=1898105 RepID=UPI001354FF7B|nr:SRPBCC family protein [Paludibacter sp.]MTK54383.1 SRPBCC family protein [Paludibacter sp.]